ncbi:MAG: hypothetical protein KC656_13445 [Myxococcales bacterium]|nr:hypothetical protein [Myxococcales bacterium]MCB9673125.1 hypothetical protein [Alphaproteobacteria bacterium]MCB9694878.1 hypothetical protein [Alphaproteobacteria bacterium]
MNTWLVARRDLVGYLRSYAGFAIISGCLLIDGLLFNFVALGQGAEYSHKVLEEFFNLTSGLTMIAAILFTMPTLAEEHDNGTDVLLRTSAVSDRSVVLGKFFGAMGMLGLLVALTAYMPAMILVNGKISLAHVAVGYLGLMLLGSSVASIGVFASSLFRTQLPAGVIGGVITVAMLLGWAGSQVTDPPFTDVLAYVALYQGHFEAFKEGRLLSGGVIFYLSVTFVFLTLATTVLQSRRHE